MPTQPLGLPMSILKGNSLRSPVSFPRLNKQD